MIQFKLQGSDATALIGGTTVIMIIIISLIAYKGNGLNKTTDYFIEGLQFGFKIFGPVIPIAALFYLGDSGFVKIIGDYLPKGSHGIINDLGIALSQTVPLNQYVSAGTLTIVGVITGLDGSVFRYIACWFHCKSFRHSTWSWNSYINSSRTNCSYMDGVGR